METAVAKKIVTKLAQLAGMTINGKNAWDIQVHNEKFYERILRDRSIGLGEAYMDSWWSCEKLDECIALIIKADLGSRVKKNFYFTFYIIISQLVNLQTKKRSLVVGEKHYDVGNHLYELMLDKEMNYSCGYWKNAENLDEAQIAKLQLVCEKLMLKPGMRILDIGCGWGGFARYAAKNYGVSVVGITISQQQYEYATTHCKGLPIEIRFQDYRDISEQFDRIVSIGMFEHVGLLNYQTYMQIVHKCLVSDGIFLLHTIGIGESLSYGDPWMVKYIFPNGMVPSIAQIGKAVEKLFVMEDWHNFGAYYDKTLISWYHNFIQSWEKLKLNYDERFKRMWSYYLLYTAGLFRARYLQVWQIVLSKNGIKDGYQSFR